MGGQSRLSEEMLKWSGRRCHPNWMNITDMSLMAANKAEHTVTFMRHENRYSSVGIELLELLWAKERLNRHPYASLEGIEDLVDGYSSSSDAATDRDDGDSAESAGSAMTISDGAKGMVESWIQDLDDSSHVYQSKAPAAHPSQT
jgi:hypothetical protein